MDRLFEFAQHHPWLVAAAVAAAIVVLAWELRVRQQEFAGVSPQELIRLMNQGALVLDLRAPDAFASGHVAGARRMDSAEILKAGETLRKHKEKPLVVYCETGSTGAAAARTLAREGFTRALNLRGGLATWRIEGLPLERTPEGRVSKEGA
jgi:rhodanese-related sulfurtransferase